MAIIRKKTLTFQLVFFFDLKRYILKSSKNLYKSSNQLYNQCVNLRKFRQEANLTQTEISKLLNINRTYYVIIETARAMPTIELWLKIQKVLKIDDGDMWKVINNVRNRI